MKTKYGYLGLGLILGLALMLVGWRVFEIARPYAYQGSLIDPPPPAADFTLTDQNGNSFKLSDQRGKVVLIFFGYTNCPDVCPVTLSQFKQVRQKLGDNANDVRFVFITVDSERDTSGKLNKFLANFDPSIIGLTGDQAALDAVYKSYGVAHEKVDVGSAAGYLVNHTAITYAIDKHGDWRLTYPFGIETDKIVQDLNHLVQEK